MKNEYNKVVDRKDVTVKNMIEYYNKSNRFKNKISWDNYYLLTGWTHKQRTKDGRGR